ncbi:hypothetical protein [Aquibaculum arenosum]|uniref:DUF3618 domain-containing protein n=1 Tax=Aquibaculum arenosum TaxID=3032591 RepID=A0ABT5YJY8_9PROT|nr:hypothetical protein [Fodinicurvata sp. CAU 1616]MDF2095252.1 hypothetical protein [Fodinicurvata sp. CAU 1616]
MNDNLHKRIRELQKQVNEAARSLEELGNEDGEVRRRLRRAGRRTGELGREAGDLAQRHPAVTGLLVLGVAAIATAWFMHGRQD